MILTEKVLERNPGLSKSQIITTLKTELNATEIAILWMKNILADGMVMFTDENAVVMNDYNTEPEFKTEILTALQAGLPTIHETGYGEQYDNYASACGFI